jgi:hypothetical protein
MCTETESTLQFGAVKWEKWFLFLMSRDQLALEKIIKDNLLNNLLNLDDPTATWYRLRRNWLSHYQAPRQSSCTEQRNVVRWAPQKKLILHCFRRCMSEMRIQFDKQSWG